MGEQVAICMATYNGGKYIGQQIESIIHQTYSDWRLFIRDDGSNDNTIDVIREYAVTLGEKIVLINDGKQSTKSSKGNFANALSWITSYYDFKYYMFCDQDDVWLDDKIEKSLRAIQQAEKENDEPILLHTDLKVVDAQLNVLGESFVKYRALNPDVRDVNHLLIQNNITGCTMMWNQKLNELIDISSECVAMHDWWFSLTAACFGKIIYLNEPTILYRQHSANVVGATKVNSLAFIINRLLGNNHVKKTILEAMEQAQAFLIYYKGKLSQNQIEDIECFATLRTHNKLVRICKSIRKGFLKQGIIQIIGELMYI